MNLFSVAAMIIVIAVAIVNKPETVLPSQSLTNATAQERRTDPAVPVPVQNNVASPNEALVWKVLKTVHQLASNGQTVNAALNPAGNSVETAVEEIIPRRNTNNSVRLPKQTTTPADKPIHSRVTRNQATN